MGGLPSDSVRIGHTWIYDDNLHRKYVLQNSVMLSREEFAPNGTIGNYFDTNMHGALVRISTTIHTSTFATHFVAAVIYYSSLLARMMCLHP